MAHLHAVRVFVGPVEECKFHAPARRALERDRSGRRCDPSRWPSHGLPERDRGTLIEESHPKCFAENLKLGLAKAPLFNSGALTSGRYGYVLRAAGTDTYWSTVKGDPGSFAGSVAVPVVINPTSGGTTTSFTVTWSAATLSGYVFDVQYRFMGAGSKSWSPYKTWQKGASAASGMFSPPSGAGTYAFSARLRNTTTGMVALWSPETSIAVH